MQFFSQSKILSKKTSLKGSLSEHFWGGEEKMFSLSWILPLAMAWGSFAQSNAQFSVLMGPTDGAHFEFSILHKKAETLSFQILLRADGKRIAPSKERRAEREFSPWVVSHAHFTDVPKSEGASLLILNASGVVVEERPLSLLRDSKKTYRVAVVSCAAGYLYEQEMWQRLNRLSLDAVIFAGDNIYGDRPNAITKKPADPKQLWELYVDARKKYDFFFRSELVPTVATWDDHDFGTDNGDQTYRYASESRQIFQDFYAQSEATRSRLEAGPGISLRWSAMGSDFILLDNRSFRTPKSHVQATMWGEDQKAWLDRTLDDSRGPIWLINGQQFFGQYRGKNAVDVEFPKDLEWLTDRLRQKASPVIFLSGDIHYTEMMDIESEVLGFPSIEVTSSSMHSLTFPGMHNFWTNPRRRDATSQHNFVVIEFQAELGRVQGNVKSFGVNDLPIFAESFEVKVR